MASQSKYPMTIWQNREQTFYRPPKRKFRWSSTHPSPESLAKAGFFFAPADSAFDNVRCFLCEKEMDGWEEDDDPLAEHLIHSKDCAWAVLMNLRMRSVDKNLGEGQEEEDPHSDKMNRLREETFGTWWPHDEKRSWNPKSTKMARAGFYYTPTEESDDMVTCAYCQLGLDGWEPKDDPIAEHRRRNPKCLFFGGFVSKPKQSTRLRTSSTRRESRVSSNFTGINAESSSTSSVAPTGPQQRRTSSRLSGLSIPTPLRSSSKSGLTADSNSSTSRLSLQALSRDSESESDEPPIKRRRSTRGRDSLDNHVSLPMARGARRKRTSSRLVSSENIIPEEDEEVTTRKDLRNSMKKEETGSDKKKDEDVDVKLVTRQNSYASKPKGKSKGAKSSERDSVSTDIRHVPQSTKRSSSGKNDVKMTEKIEEKEDEDNLVKHKGKRKTNRTASRTKRAERKEMTHFDRSDSEDSTSVDSSEEEVGKENVNPAVIRKGGYKSAGTRRRMRSSVDEDKQHGKQTKEDEEIVRLRSQGKSSNKIRQSVDKSERDSSSPVTNLFANNATSTRSRRSSARSSASNFPEEVKRIDTLRTKRSMDTLVEEQSEPSRKSKKKRGRPPRIQKSQTPQSPNLVLSDSDEEERTAFEDTRESVGNSRGNNNLSKARDASNNVRRNEKSLAGRGKARGKGRGLPSSKMSKDADSANTDVPDGRVTPMSDAHEEIVHSPPMSIEHTPLTPPEMTRGFSTNTNPTASGRREAVSKARRELQEQILAEGGPASPDEYVNSDGSEDVPVEMGKGPFRTVRGKKEQKGALVAPVINDEDEESEGNVDGGESNAMALRAMISPLRPGVGIVPVGEPNDGDGDADDDDDDGDYDGDEGDDEDDESTTARARLRTSVRSVQPPQHYWTPAVFQHSNGAAVHAISPPASDDGQMDVEAVSALSPEEEDMTVEQWMRWITGVEVGRLEGECERMVRGLEREARRARRVLEGLA